MDAAIGTLMHPNPRLRPSCFWMEKVFSAPSHGGAAVTIRQLKP